MLRKTTASVFKVVPATPPKLPDESDGGGAAVPGSAGGNRASARWRRTRAGAAQPYLAVREVIGRAPADDDPRDRPAALRAGLSLAGVDEELFLHRTLLLAAVAVIVDRGDTAVDSPLQRRHDRV